MRRIRRIITWIVVAAGAAAAGYVAADEKNRGDHR